MTSPKSNESSGSRAARHRDLEAIALTSLRLGRLLMEAGARARVVDACVVELAKGLGAESACTRAGYASLEMTVHRGEVTSTRMVTVGYHGVNQRLDQALRQLAQRAGAERLTPADVDQEVNRLLKDTPHHPEWLMSVSAGFACAAFARLLGADWLATAAVLFGSTFGQTVRMLLRKRQANVFIIATIVAFLGSTAGGLIAKLLGSDTVSTAMVASILLLVPGVPSLNALSDILEGRPTLGSARAVTVLMIMVFAATGLWIGGIVLHVGLR